MLKITAIGNLINDVELKMNPTTGKPYAILRLASDRRYRSRDGGKLTDFVSRCAAPWPSAAPPSRGRTASWPLPGTSRRSPSPEDSTRQPGFLIKASEVESLSPRRVEEAAEALPAREPLPDSGAVCA